MNSLDKHGYTQLRGLLSAEAIDGLRALLAQEADEAGTSDGGRLITRSEAGGEFRRYSNNLDFRHRDARLAWQSKGVRSLFDGLLGRRWLLTQAFGFELSAGDGGLEWHFGFRSFSFIDPEDPAYTLWIPLDSVDPTGQGGGLAVASRQVYSGREETRLMASVCASLDDRSLVHTVLSNLRGFRALREPVLERSRTDLPYTPGDALLFDRYTFHRSVAFRPGPQATRRAIALRFVPGDAVFNPTLVHQQTRLFSMAGVPPHNNDILDVFSDIQAGQTLGTSRSAVWV